MVTGLRRNETNWKFMRPSLFLAKLVQCAFQTHSTPCSFPVYIVYLILVLLISSLRSLQDENDLLFAVRDRPVKRIIMTAHPPGVMAIACCEGSAHLQGPYPSMSRLSSFEAIPRTFGNFQRRRPEKVASSTGTLETIAMLFSDKLWCEWSCYFENLLITRSWITFYWREIVWHIFVSICSPPLAFMNLHKSVSHQLIAVSE